MKFVIDGKGPSYAGTVLEKCLKDAGFFEKIVYAPSMPELVDEIKNGVDGLIIPRGHGDWSCIRNINQALTGEWEDLPLKFPVLELYKIEEEAIKQQRESSPLEVRAIKKWLDVEYQIWS
jgi:hypothetical protein